MVRYTATYEQFIRCAPGQPGAIVYLDEYCLRQLIGVWADKESSTWDMALSVARHYAEVRLDLEADCFAVNVTIQQQQEDYWAEPPACAPTTRYATCFVHHGQHHSQHHSQRRNP